MAKDLKKENAEQVAQAVSSTEQFLDENKKTITIAVIAVLVLFLAIFCYQKYVVGPKKAEAMEQTYPAEALFRDSDYEKALNGDGNVLGFQQILDEYGSKAPKSAYLYAGICALQQGNYEDAVNYLKKYKGKDSILSARATACIGDAYVGLEKLDQAVTYFEKAAGKADNMFAADYLLKAGVVYEELGKADQALACYKQIKEKYPQSIVGYDIDKYITRVETK